MSDTVAGYVYLLAGGGYHKIGKAVDVKRRVRQHSLPFKIEILHTLYVPDMNRAETALKRYFAPKQVRGEWFVLNDEDVTFVRALMPDCDLLNPTVNPAIDCKASLNVPGWAYNFMIERAAAERRDVKAEISILLERAIRAEMVAAGEEPGKSMEMDEAA